MVRLHSVALGGHETGTTAGPDFMRLVKLGKWTIDVEAVTGWSESWFPAQPGGTTRVKVTLHMHPEPVELEEDESARFLAYVKRVLVVEDPGGPI